MSSSAIPLLNWNKDLLWQHPTQEFFCLFLLLGELCGSVFYQLLQMVSVLLHHVDHLVNKVDLAVHRTPKNHYISDKIKDLSLKVT